MANNDFQIDEPVDRPINKEGYYRPLISDMERVRLEEASDNKREVDARGNVTIYISPHCLSIAPEGLTTKIGISKDVYPFVLTTDPLVMMYMIPEGAIVTWKFGVIEEIHRRVRAPMVVSKNPNVSDNMTVVKVHNSDYNKDMVAFLIHGSDVMPDIQETMYGVCVALGLNRLITNENRAQYCKSLRTVIAVYKADLARARLDTELRLNIADVVYTAFCRYLKTHNVDRWIQLQKFVSEVVLGRRIGANVMLEMYRRNLSRIITMMMQQDKLL